jgi:hypothetical protein
MEYITGIERNGNNISLICKCIFNYNQIPNISVFYKSRDILNDIFYNGYSKKYHPVEYKHVIDHIKDWFPLIQEHCINHVNSKGRSCEYCNIF